jgi:subtilase family serine protease
MQFECLEARRLLSAYPLSPSQVIDAYGINQISFGPARIVGDGTGQTIAIIDGGDDPALVDSTASNFATSDLGVFDSQFGLPTPNFTVVGETGLPGSRPIAANYPTSSITSAKESGNTTVTITMSTSCAALGLATADTVWISGVGVAGYNGSQIITSTGSPNADSFTYSAGSGLANSSGGTVSTNPVDPGETTLDVEWAHAMAPGAKIVLIELNGPTGGSDGPGGTFDAAGMVNAITQAVPHVGATVVSMSIAEPEFSGETGASTSNYDDGLFTTQRIGGRRNQSLPDASRHCNRHGIRHQQPGHEQHRDHHHHRLPRLFRWRLGHHRRCERQEL